MKITLPIRRGRILKGPDSDAHYYDQRGNPRYDVTDIRQARKLNLLPSPTTKLGMSPAAPIVNWKVLNGMEAALTTKRRIPAVMPVGAKEIWDLPADLDKPEFEIQVAGDKVAGPFPSYDEALRGLTELRTTQPDLWESEENWGKRIGENYEEIISRASKFGSHFHDQMEQIARGQPIPAPKDDPVYPFARQGEVWFRENITRVYAVEAVIINFDNLTAGKTDLIAEHKDYGLVFLDWKTQNIKKSDKETGRPVPEFYDKWAAQLGVYRSGVVAQPPPGFPAGLDLRKAKCMNVVFDSNVPGPAHEYVWTDRDMEEAAERFNLCSQMFVFEKKYTPELDEAARDEVLSRQPEVRGPDDDPLGLDGAPTVEPEAAPPDAVEAPPASTPIVFKVHSTREPMKETATSAAALVELAKAYEGSEVGQITAPPTPAPVAPATPAPEAEDGTPRF